VHCSVFKFGNHFDRFGTIISKFSGFRSKNNKKAVLLKKALAASDQ
jgi:hypothetical protein